MQSLEPSEEDVVEPGRDCGARARPMGGGRGGDGMLRDPLGDSGEPVSEAPAGAGGERASGWTGAPGSEAPRPAGGPPCVVVRVEG